MGEYLQLLRGAGGAQSLRLRRAFEQKNLRLSAVLAELRGRLRHYTRRLSELDAGIQLLRASRPRGPSLQAAMPLADAKAHQVRFEPDGEAGTEEDANTEEDGDEEWADADADSAGTPNQDFPGGMGAAEWADQHLNLLSLLEEITELKEAQVVLEVSLKGLTEELGRDYTVLEQMVQEETYRSNQLQSQMNDLIDLHQNEVINLKSELASLEEKIAYQSYESSRDIWEVLESFQVKLDSLEQLQQVSQVESREVRGTRELVGKCMNLLLMVFAVVLMAMSTVAALVLPFIRTRARTVTTGLALLIVLGVWRNWNSFNAWPGIRESQGE
ncbi:transmembrane and coiled-coil domains protein 2-like [Leucoraja erinacea]|uniref:transmembrane and coiled-coil domains protein 2-like n=1 Tax=Leucoraja erinaceus TaxID=7782 RepID=UPI00245876E7|nr:transmembrane and coiled-coil domains protein 2-like [Leucoraja erinacea]